MRTLPLLLAVGLAACSQPVTNTAPPKAPAAVVAEAPKTTAPAGDYELDHDHTSIDFRVNHIGLSQYTARFADASGRLKFDPANPAAQAIEVTIPVASLKTDYKGPPALDFDKEVQTKFVGGAQNPQITFRSTKVDVTGPATARVTGDLTLNGVTRPIVIDARFNGGYAKGEMDPTAARIGFSGKTSFKRSDFGLKDGLPAPGTNMGVFDEVAVDIETEFTRK